MKNVWIKQGNTRIMQEITDQDEKLDNGIYKLDYDPDHHRFFLTKIADNFKFDYKIYGHESKFINHFVKTYNATNGNIGMLLNGVKGTGKSVTGKLICNELKQPVILVHTAYEGIENYLNRIQQDCIVFLDEYEKMFEKRQDHSVLTMMDGVLDGEFRKTFILTTNNKYINENMIERPKRIRYVHTFKDLTKDVITEMVDDILIHPHLREKCVEFISKLQTITTDIVKSVIEEVNIHAMEPEEFKDFFNVQVEDKKVSISYFNDKDELILLVKETDVDFDDEYGPEVEQHVYIKEGRTYLGQIKTIISDDTFMMDLTNVDGKPKKNVKVLIEKVVSFHQSFKVF